MKKKYINENTIRKIVRTTLMEAFSDLYQWQHFDNDFTDEEDDAFDEAIDAWTLSEVLRQHGWSYYNSEEIAAKNGKDYVRYIITKDNSNASDINTVLNAIKAEATKPDGIILANGQYNYAPEIKKYAIYVEIIGY